MGGAGSRRSLYEVLDLRRAAGPWRQQELLREGVLWQVPWTHSLNPPFPSPHTAPLYKTSP